MSCDWSCKFQIAIKVSKEVHYGSRNSKLNPNKITKFDNILMYKFVFQRQKTPSFLWLTAEKKIANVADVIFFFTILDTNSSYHYHIAYTVFMAINKKKRKNQVWSHNKLKIHRNTYYIYRWILEYVCTNAGKNGEHATNKKHTYVDTGAAIIIIIATTRHHTMHIHTLLLYLYKRCVNTWHLTNVRKSHQNHGL